MREKYRTDQQSRDRGMSMERQRGSRTAPFFVIQKNHVLSSSQIERMKKTIDEIQDLLMVCETEMEELLYYNRSPDTRRRRSHIAEMQYENLIERKSVLMQEIIDL